MKITFKHITYAAIFLLVAALTFQSYRLSVKSNKLKDANSELVILEYKLASKQDSINLFKSRTVVLEHKSDSLIKVIIKLQKDKKILDKKLIEALANVDLIPTDESYSFLQDSAYNYPGELKYPFNNKQVTEIHKDFIENIMLERINVNLVTTVDVFKEQIMILDSLISNQYVQLDLYDEMIGSYKGIITTVEKEKDKLNKDIIKQKRVKYIFQGISVAEALVILISLL